MEDKDVYVKVPASCMNENQEEEVTAKAKKNFRYCRNMAGFTLVELIVVMVILGMLAALVFPKLLPKVFCRRYSFAALRYKQLANYQGPFAII